MEDLDWRSQSEPAALVQALAAHRLLPMTGLLIQRGLVRRDLAGLAASLARKSALETADRFRIEQEVLASFEDAGVPALLLKGALLARTVYPSPDARLRTDMDLLVAPEQVQTAAAALRRVGFRPSQEQVVGPSMEQSQWVRDGDDPVHAVDLHWDLFNQPLLKERFERAALFERAGPVPGVGGDILGLSPEDALLHAAVHYLGHHRNEFRPDQWLLDIDLLWSAMSSAQHDAICERALQVGVASLLAEALSRTVDRFGTTVEDQRLAALRSAGASEPVRRLALPVRSPALAVLHRAWDEPGVGAKARHLWRLAFPPRAWMRRKYPTAPAWSLPWLYLRRMWEGARKS